MSFRRVLVANRGEIACRVLRTLRAMGLETAGVYSDADAEAPHVALSGRARRLGPAAPSESYLDVRKVVEAAGELGCDALHPGYGFLSENAGLATACAEAGITFIGPSPEVIRAMGDKKEARRLAQEAGVPPVPGYEGTGGDRRLRKEADRIGYPLLVKAARGGGGKGMRRVGAAGELEGALAGARREARGAFGDESLILERLLHPVRHVEVQVFGDAQGRVAPLLERECSLQRRHQKVVEECPSPAVDADLRRRLGSAACRLARQVGYTGAGTVEFLLDGEGRFHFLEMNTRLQVEHGVTEMVTGLDLVAWQVRVAAGEPIPWTEEQPPEPGGHAVEVRVYAEDPARGYLPQSGRLEDLRLPAGPGVRVDSGIRAGMEVGLFYDPLLAKVLAHGEDREAARRRLVEALRETRIAGPVNNLGHLMEILEGEAFCSGATFTDTLEAAGPPAGPPGPPPEVLWLAAAALQQPLRPGSGAEAADPAWAAYDPFRTLGAFRILEEES